MLALKLDLRALNYWAIVAAAAATMVIGFLWYSPVLFGPAWLSLSGVSPEQAEAAMGSAFIWGSLVALVAAFCLAVVFSRAGVAGWCGGVELGLLVWLGFTLTTRAYGVIFAGRPLALLAIDSGSELVSYAAMGAILGAWRKRA